MARAAASVSGRRGDRVATSVGSEIEALLREALLIRDLQPVVNVQTAAPTLATRAIPSSLVQDVVLLVPSIDPDAAELVAARDDGAIMLQRTRRCGAELARHSRNLWTFFTERSGAAGDGSAPLVFSWLAGRGLHTTRAQPARLRISQAPARSVGSTARGQGLVFRATYRGPVGRQGSR